MEMKGYYSNFLIMRRYLFCITTFVLLVKSPLPSYFFMISVHLFRMEQECLPLFQLPMSGFVLLPGSMMTSGVAGRQHHPVSYGTGVCGSTSFSPIFRIQEHHITCTRSPVVASKWMEEALEPVAEVSGLFLGSEKIKLSILRTYLHMKCSHTSSLAFST